MITPMLRLAVAACALLTFAVTPVSAGFIVPTAGPEVGGVSTVFRQFPRTYMAYYDSSLFASITQPTMLTGVSFRLSAGSLPAPGATINFSSYTMQLSNASAILDADGEFLSATSNYAAMQGSNVATVRSGPLTLTANSFPGGVAPPFANEITFSTPYLYTPGEDLVMYLTHSGFTPPAADFFMAVGAYNGPGTWDAISSLTGNAPASTGFSNPYIAQFTTLDASAVPAPATALLGLLAIPALRRLRKRG